MNIGNYIKILILGMLFSCVPRHKKSEIILNLENYSNDSLTNNVEKKSLDSTSKKYDFAYEQREKLVFDNYQAFHDSIRILDRNKLKYSNGRFYFSKFDSKTKLEVESIIEHRPGIATYDSLYSKSYPFLEFREIRFYNKELNRINTWNVRNQNPWKKEIVKKIYDFPNYPIESISDLISDPNRKNKIDKYVAYNHYSIQKNTGVINIIYELQALDVNESLIEISSYIISLDSIGNELFRYKLNDLGVENCHLTADNKYLLINGGGVRMEGMKFIDLPFIQIIKTLDNSIIYHSQNKDKFEMFQEFSSQINNPLWIIIDIHCYKWNHETEEIIFKLDKMEKCVFRMGLKEYNDLKVKQIPYTAKNWLIEFPFVCKKI